MATIVVGADHAGYALKEYLKTWLEEQGFQVEDVGCFSEDSCDYPDIAAELGRKIEAGDVEQGVLCCGSGIGMAIGANRFPKVRAFVCGNHFEAEMSRRHNDANVICFGARVVAKEYAQGLLALFLNTAFEGAHHQGRVGKLAQVTTMPKEVPHA